MAAPQENISATAPVDYDERLAKAEAEIEAEKNATLSELEQTYAEMTEQSDAFYEAQIGAARDYAEKQSAIQQQQTDFAIEQIEQQKEQTQKDYIKEQSGAYADWRKQSGEYGAEAEKMAASGLKDTGYSETSQVLMYNQWQKRVATAREVVNRAILNYDNQMTQARLQNNAALAEIAYNALQAELEFALAGFQHKNQLVLDEASKKLEIESYYDDRYMDVYNQILAEKEFEEGVRQFNEELALAQSKMGATSSGGVSTGGTSSGGGGTSLSIDKGDMVQPAETSADTEADTKKPTETPKKSFSPSYQVQNGLKNGQATTVSQWEATEREPEVSTEFYRGPLNKDATKYGVFENGYQPKGVGAHGELTDTGDYVRYTTQTRDGRSVTVTRRVWEAANGTQWYWDSVENKYKQITINYGGGAAGGGLGGTTAKTRE